MMVERALELKNHLQRQIDDLDEFLKFFYINHDEESIAYVCWNNFQKLIIKPNNSTNKIIKEIESDLIDYLDKQSFKTQLT